MDLYPPRKPAKVDEAAKLSFLRRNWRRARFVTGGPIATIGIKEISSGVRLINDLWAALPTSLQPGSRIKNDEDGSMDLKATAFLYGIAVDELGRQLRQRRAQTCRAAYATFGLGSLSLLLWLYGALHVRMSSARIVSAVEFLPFCTLFFLLAFKAAWMNWQLRTLRMGSAVAFLRTTEPFLPR